MPGSADQKRMAQASSTPVSLEVATGLFLQSRTGLSPSYREFPEGSPCRREGEEARIVRHFLKL